MDNGGPHRCRVISTGQRLSRLRLSARPTAKFSLRGGGGKRKLTGTQQNYFESAGRITHQIGSTSSSRVVGTPRVSFEGGRIVGYASAVARLNRNGARGLRSR